MADISVVKLPNNSSYNLKDANAIHGDGRAELKYINSHPENNPTILPFINNDIAFFSVRGGTYSVYTTTSTDYTPITLSGIVSKDINLGNTFDGSPSYSSLTPAITNLTDKIVIDLTLFRKFSETNVFYIDFGYAWWAPKSITYLTLNPQSNTYEVFKEVSLSSSIGSFMSRNGWRSYNADNTVYDYGRTKIRIVVTNFNSKDTRIAQIGLLQYNSPGIRETNMSRGIDDPIYRSITPNTNNSYNLGTSSKKWANGYFTNINGVAVGSSPKFTDTTYSVATTSSNGLMSSSDKTKLNGISSSYDSATETLTINL